MSLLQHNKLSEKETISENIINKNADPLNMSYNMDDGMVEEEKAVFNNELNKINEMSGDLISVKEKEMKPMSVSLLLPKMDEELQKDDKKKDSLLVEEEKKDSKEEKLTDKQKILAYEEKSGDYETYGIAFDLEHCRINAADSKNMRRLKMALKEYLEVKEEILKSLDLRADRERGKRNDIKLIHRYGDGVEIDEATGGVIEKNDIGTAARDQFGEKYDALWWALGLYDGGITLFKHGRGRKRLNQAKRVRELMEADNRKYWLSPERRSLKTPGGDDAARAMSEKWPNYSGFVRNKDMIANRMQRYKDRKRKGERVRFWHGWGRNIRDFGAMMYHGIVGSVERVAAIPLMLAGNAIKLAGKVAKTPLHLLSGAFNKICKWSGSETRWRMDSFKDTWKKGWVNYNDGREAYRNLLFAGVLGPLGITVETIFLELLQGKRVVNPEGNHFAFTRGLMTKFGRIGGRHLRHLVKGMGITSKHYKDRNMLTPEDMGDVSYRVDIDDENEDLSGDE